MDTFPFSLDISCKNYNGCLDKCTQWMFANFPCPVQNLQAAVLQDQACLCVWWAAAPAEEGHSAQVGKIGQNGNIFPTKLS